MQTGRHYNRDFLLFLVRHLRVEQKKGSLRDPIKSTPDLLNIAENPPLI
jgi:hypothetical protein